MIQKVADSLDKNVINPYNEIKNDMNVLKSRSNDLKLRTTSSLSNIYVYVFFIVMAIIAVLTKKTFLILFSAIILGFIVFINILYYI